MGQHRRPSKTSGRNQDRPSDGTPNYEIGYGRPPVSGRFKAGQSGNPKGKPKRNRNVRIAVEQALNETIQIREGSRTRSLTKLDGVILKLLDKALHGDAKAHSSLIALLRSVGMTAERTEPSPTEPVTSVDEDIVADFLRRHGKPGREEVP